MHELIQSKKTKKKYLCQLNDQKLQRQKSLWYARASQELPGETSTLGQATGCGQYLDTWQGVLLNETRSQKPTKNGRQWHSYENTFSKRRSTTATRGRKTGGNLSHDFANILDLISFFFNFSIKRKGGKYLRRNGVEDDNGTIGDNNGMRWGADRDHPQWARRHVGRGRRR